MLLRELLGCVSEIASCWKDMWMQNREVVKKIIVMECLDRDTLTNSVFKSLAWNNSALIIKVASVLDISSLSLKGSVLYCC